MKKTLIALSPSSHYVDADAEGALEVKKKKKIFMNIFCVKLLA